jgi:alpha-2-macroglobulin
MKTIAGALLLLLLLPCSAFAANGLEIVAYGPVGETGSLAESNEIRVVFSEPMVVLGKIPEPVTAPFFKIDPPVTGSFRWSGTTTLIFTPKPQLPFATTFNVTIDKSAKSVSGKTLAQPLRWSFTTPTIRLLRTDWYRKGNKTDAPVVIALRFNQKVDPATVAAHLQLRTRAHSININDIPSPERLAKTDPQALAAFEAKRAKARAAAASNNQPIFANLAADWDKKRFTPGDDLVVLETKPNIPSDTQIEIMIDEKLAPSARHARSRAQAMTLDLEHTLFVDRIDCRRECDPDWRNPIIFRSTAISFDAARKAVSVTDITDPAKEAVVKPKSVTRAYEYPTSSYGLDELGYSLQPGRMYAVRVDPALTAEDGQTLGHAWVAVVEVWHRSAFISFGSGHGVWESSGGSILPFHARNYRTVKQWLAPLKIDQLFPAMQQLRESNFTLAPPNAKEQTRKLNTPPDKIAAVGLDLAPAIGNDNTGLAWAAIQPLDELPRAKTYEEHIVATLVQATNLGITVKDSPQNTVIMVTRLDNGDPVAGAKVSIRDRKNKVFWTGTTDVHGLAVAPNTDLRRDKEKKKDGEEQDEWEIGWRALYDLHFVVIAEKDGDVAYVGSDWNEGIQPWDFDTRYDVMEAEPLLRGTIFADRGVYKLGEEIHFKAIARADTPMGVKLLAPGTKLDVVLRDAHNAELDARSVTVNQWSSAEWTFRLPPEAPLGNYSISASNPKHRGSIGGNFLVAAYRRPDFRVDVTLNANQPIAGTQLDGRITGRYLFGASMAGKPMRWTFRRERLWDVPAKITDRYPYNRYTFLGWDWDDEEEDDGSGEAPPQEGEAQLDAKGELKLSLDTQADAGWPYSYTLEGVVTDVTRQQIAGRMSKRVEAAPWYIGVKTLPYFAEAADGIDTEIVAVGHDGLAVAGVKVHVTLKRIQWTSVRKAEGNGFYTWETERKEIDAGEWNITTDSKPKPLKIPLKEGGRYMLVAKAEDGKGRSTATRAGFYALGAGYTAWERFDHNRIELVPEKTIYKPGETARIMVKSPWESATALLTTEREGVRTWTPFQLTSTQQTIEVPITEQEIPNVFVSVVLIKGRTKQDPDKDGSDPGKPAFRLGYVELEVEDAAKRLAVDVKANRSEFRPATKAKIEVDVKDAEGRPAASEVTLWAVDYGVLSLTGYSTPDVLKSIYLMKALQVATEDSRQRIVSRRVLTPKGAGEGGGGGADAGPGTLRRDFRVLAFWVGSLVTNANGKATKEITLPESLTTYRIMAVAADKQSRFGWGQNEIRVNKPLMLTPAWPRFLTVGDKAHFGAVVHNQLKSAGKATVTIESMNSEIVEVKGSTTVDAKPGATIEARFDAVAKAVGDARIRMRVNVGRESDAFEDILPVRVVAVSETVAAYGEAKPTAQETIEIPTGIVPGTGGLRVDLASTALVGLSEGARYLVEYPYGCAEQRASTALGLMLITDLGESFSLPGIEPGKQKEAVQETLDGLRKFQCGDGGFAYWPDGCAYPSSAYLTSYVLHVMQRGKMLQYRVDQTSLDRAYTFLESQLGTTGPQTEGWIVSYHAWQAFAVKVLAEGGRNVDSHFNRVYENRERMPIFGITHLLDALIAKKETASPRAAELKRRIMNGISPEGGFAFVNELNDPYLKWFWSSNPRTTAMALGTLVRHGSEPEMATRMVRWLLRIREDGRWGNTQENAWAMEALVDFYRKYESEVPDFVAKVALGPATVGQETFKGRTTHAKSKVFDMRDVLAKGPAGSKLPVTFTREGTGTLYYMMRLRYTLELGRYQPLDQGFKVERAYFVDGTTTPVTSFKAGDVIRVNLRIRATKERRFVAVTDPIPAGTEPVETWFATTATELVEQQQQMQGGDGWAWWLRGGFDHVERHDDRVNLFATRLSEGTHDFAYLVRATTAGTFITAPTHVEEMYEPEVFGRTGTVTVEVKK